MENITKEQLITFINSLLDVMESSHIYVDELTENCTEEEIAILKQTKYSHLFEKNQ